MAKCPHAKKTDLVDLEKDVSQMGRQTDRLIDELD